MILFCYWDISFVFDLNMLIWFGDMLFQQEWVVWLDEQCLVNVGWIIFLLYIGVYVDGFLYYCVDGLFIGQVLLDIYMGLCWVIYCIGVNLLVIFEYFVGQFDDLFLWVLLWIFEWVLVNWLEGFCVIVLVIIECFVECGVRLVGIDILLFDFQYFKIFDVYYVVGCYGMVIFEGVVFDDVFVGDYELFVLLLKFIYFDVSLVCVVLCVLFIVE